MLNYEQGVNLRKFLFLLFIFVLLKFFMIDTSFLCN